MVSIIYIIGPPASGKTTICNLLSSALAPSTVKHISLDHGYYALCPENAVSPRYKYEADGSLLLIDRNNLLRESLHWMNNQMKAHIVQGNTKYILVELYHLDYRLAFNELHELNWSVVWVIEVNASWNNRLLRNKQRAPRYQVPDEYMQMTHTPSSFSPNMLPTSCHHIKYFNKHPLNSIEVKNDIISMSMQIRQFNQDSHDG